VPTKALDCVDFAKIGRVYCPRRHFWTTSHHIMTHATPPHVAAVSELPRVVDTRGDEPFGWVYVAVVATEVAVLTGLWLFSRYFSG
jgi:hypothetical protein